MRDQGSKTSSSNALGECTHTPNLSTAKPDVNPLAGYRFSDCRIEEETRDLVSDKRCVHRHAPFLVIDVGSILSRTFCVYNVTGPKVER